MRLSQVKKLLVLLSILIALPIVAVAQTTQPNLKKPAPKYKPLVPVGTNLKVRLNETLSSKQSRAGHIRSIVQSGKVKGRTTLNLNFDSIALTNGKHGAMHGYITKVYGSKASADNEGGVQSESRGNQTVKRTGVGATAGAIVGGLAGLSRERKCWSTSRTDSIDPEFS